MLYSSSRSRAAAFQRCCEPGCLVLSMQKHHFLRASVRLEHPASHGLTVVEGAWNGHVGLDVLEADRLQGPVRRDVEGVGLAEEPFQRQNSEIECDRLAQTCRPDPRLAALWVDDVEVHVGLLAIDDL